jgi:hypothetical protein
MDPFTAMLRVLEAMFWVAAGMFAIVYRIVRFLFFFWRAHHKTPLEFPLSARFEHTHIVGGSGHGKTQLLQQLILNDLDGVKSGQASIIVIDSQGDMLKNILSLSQVGKMQDRLVLIDPVIDIQNPPALNLFDLGLKRLGRYDEIEQEKLINGAIALYEYVFGALLGAELTNRQGVIFRYLARLMMTVPGANIYTLMEFMDKPNSVRPHLDKLDRSARYFFETQFFSPDFDTTRHQILTRLWGVLSNRTLERMLDNEQNKVDLFEAMNKGSIILINTAKDLLKQEGCEILGRFFIALIAQAVQERASLPEDKRLPTFVFIDEAQDYFDESIESLLNQGRKYKVGLIIAHQNLDQFSQKLRASVMASTSIKLVGGLSAKDTAAFAREMGCEEAFISERRKHQKHTEFACVIRNHTREPRALAVPLGLMEREPRMSEKEREAMLSANRLRICGERRDVRSLAGPKVGEEAERAAVSQPEML